MLKKGRGGGKKRGLLRVKSGKRGGTLRDFLVLKGGKKKRGKHGTSYSERG